MNVFWHEKEKDIYFSRLWCLKKLHLKLPKFKSVANWIQSFFSFYMYNRFSTEISSVCKTSMFMHLCNCLPIRDLGYLLDVWKWIKLIYATIPIPNTNYFKMKMPQHSITSCVILSQHSQLVVHMQACGAQRTPIHIWACVMDPSADWTCLPIWTLRSFSKKVKLNSINCKLIYQTKVWFEIQTIVFANQTILSVKNAKFNDWIC